MDYWLVSYVFVVIMEVDIVLVSLRVCVCIISWFISVLCYVVLKRMD